MANTPFSPTLTPQPYAGVGKAALLEGFPIPGDLVGSVRGPLRVEGIRIDGRDTFVVEGRDQRGFAQSVGVAACWPLTDAEVEEYQEVEAIRDAYNLGGFPAALEVLQQIKAGSTG